MFVDELLQIRSRLPLRTEFPAETADVGANLAKILARLNLVVLNTVNGIADIVEVIPDIGGMPVG
jgi:hypothetical protein